MKTEKQKKVMGAALAVALLGASAQATVVAQYSFEGNQNDSAAGGSVADGLSYHQGVSANASATFTGGVVGQAGVFDGNHFSAPNSADLNITNNWTIEAFISISAANVEWERTVVKWGTGGQDYHFGLRNRSLNLFEGTGGGVEVVAANTTPATSFDNGAWHHIAISSSPAGSEAWIDGVSVSTGASIVFPTSGVPLGIGDFAPGQGENNALRFHGRMDEVLIHNAAVDQSYINGRAALLIPEPSSLSLTVLAALGLLSRRRR